MAVPEPTTQYVLAGGKSYVKTYGTNNDTTVNPPISYTDVSYTGDILDATYFDETTAKSYQEVIGGTVYKVTHTYEEVTPTVLGTSDVKPTTSSNDVVKSTEVITPSSSQSEPIVVKIGEDIPDDLSKNVDK